VDDRPGRQRHAGRGVGWSECHSVGGEVDQRDHNRTKAASVQLSSTVHGMIEYANQVRAQRQEGLRWFEDGRGTDPALILYRPSPTAIRPAPRQQQPSVLTAPDTPIGISPKGLYRRPSSGAYLPNVMAPR
jgi:hypothetical protein